MRIAFLSACVALVAVTAGAQPPTSSSGASRNVLLVGNSVNGTVSVIDDDGTTFRNLGTINVIPDLGRRMTNMNLLFWLSIVPFTTAYLGESHASRLAVGLYGAVAGVCALSYYLLRHAIACQTHEDPKVSHLHRCMQRKNRIAMGIYAGAVVVACVSPWLALALILLPSGMYFVPDREVEKLIGE